MTKIRVAADEFVKTWQSSKTVGDVSKKLGITNPVLCARAVRYRKSGIPLKKFTRGAVLNVAALKELATKTKTS